LLTRLPSGKLQIPCLWKTKCPTLKNNFKLAKKILFSLLSSKLITTTSNLLDDYNAIFKKWEKANYIEQINNPYPHRQGMWYSPHFPVVRMHKETTKIRPVFDCAAKYQGLSLNDCLMQGPQVMNELVTVLHHFRNFDVAMTGDIAEMFLQAQVPQQEIDKLRSLLYVEGQLQVYRWNVHLFGKTDRPFIAMMAVFTTIMENKNLYPEAFAIITTASLVNDMADSRPSTQQVKVLIDQLSEFFPKHCSMHIRKYVANDLD
jgi:hypothetical protein